MDAEVGKKLRALEAITTLHHSVGANLELGEVAAILVGELKRITGCEGCAVMLIEGTEARILAESGFARAFGEGTLSVNMPAIDYLIRGRRSLRTGNIKASPAATCVPAGCAMNSLICTPVFAGGDVRGIVHLDSSRYDAFDEDDLTFVELLAREVSIVFERSLTYSRTKGLSITDGLTGCLNRRAFEDDLKVDFAHSRRWGQPLSLLMVDVDGFKGYNDVHGHPGGDSVLTSVASSLAGDIRPGDRLYRYGGDEFAILLPGADSNAARHVADRLRALIESRGFDAPGKSQPRARLTISVGSACFPADATDEQALVACADSALYRAKGSGRNRACAYEAATGVDGATASRLRAAPTA